MWRVKTASWSWLFHGLHPLHIPIPLDHFMVLAVSQSQPSALTLFYAAKGISVFKVALVLSVKDHWHLSGNVYRQVICQVLSDQLEWNLAGCVYCCSQWICTTFDLGGSEVKITGVTKNSEKSKLIKRQEIWWLLTHWGRVMHICISKLTITGSDNGLSPGRRQAIIWTNDGILLIGPLRTSFSEIWIEIYTFSFSKMHLKMVSILSRPQCVNSLAPGDASGTRPSHESVLTFCQWDLWHSPGDEHR